MGDIQTRKARIEKAIVDVILSGLESDQINEEELPDIADFVLDHMDAATADDQLIQFLRDLSTKWTIFTPILITESGETKGAEEDKVMKQVLELAKENKIEEAVSLAKTATG